MLAAHDVEKAGAARADGASLRSRGDQHLVLAGVAIEAGLIAFFLLSGVWRGSHWLIPSFLLPASLYFLTLVVTFRTLDHDPRTARTRWIILGFAALFHLTLFASPHPLSNDLYRYLWDGKILAHGVNPYALPPAHEALAPFRDSNWGLIFNRDIPTGYPPLAELLFAGNHVLDLGGTGLRLISIACSLGVCAVLMGVLRHLELDERKVIVYAWSPLVAVEFGNSGHFDAAAILFLALAFYLHLREKPAGTACCLALGGLMKFFPALLAPVWGRRWGWRPWLVFLLLFFPPWLPFVPDGTPFTGLGIFGSRVDFNGSVFGVFKQVWSNLLPAASVLQASRMTSLVVFGLAAVILSLRTWHTADRKGDWRFAFLLMGWSLIVSPVVHPWYLCWMLAFIAIEWGAAWVVLSGSVIFARHVYLGYEASGMWRESMWPRWAVYLPFYLTFCFQWAGEVIRSMTRRTVVPRKLLVERETR